MGLHRFYVTDLATSGPLALDESEARHASSVLRLKVGEEVLAFDGCGGEARCHVAAVTKREVKLDIVERLDRNCELGCQLHLLVALPKGDRQKTLIDYLVQVGVNSLSPLITARGVAQPVDAALARLRRAVIESSKQCGRNRLMEIREPISISQLLSAEPTAIDDGVDSQVTRLFAHPYGQVTALRRLPSQTLAAGKIQVLIGPEGGFTEQEAEQLRLSHWTAVSLGPRILRVEVAAGHIASWLAETYGGQA